MSFGSLRETTLSIKKFILDSNLRILYTVDKEIGFLPSKIL
jgi:hypothetical protein